MFKKRNGWSTQSLHDLPKLLVKNKITNCYKNINLNDNYVFSKESLYSNKYHPIKLKLHKKFGIFSLIQSNSLKLKIEIELN